MSPKRMRPRARDQNLGLHNLLGVPGPQILRSEEDALWSNLRKLPGGGGVQAAVYAHSVQIERRPWARIDLTTIEARMNDVVTRYAYAVFIWQMQIEATRGPNLECVITTPPCSWCGLPTGCFCDWCKGPICTACDHKVSECRKCHDAP